MEEKHYDDNDEENDNGGEHDLASEAIVLGLAIEINVVHNRFELCVCEVD